MTRSSGKMIHRSLASIRWLLRWLHPASEPNSLIWFCSQTRIPPYSLCFDIFPAMSDLGKEIWLSVRLWTSKWLLLTAIVPWLRAILASFSCLPVFYYLVLLQHSALTWILKDSCETLAYPHRSFRRLCCFNDALFRTHPGSSKISDLGKPHLMRSHRKIHFHQKSVILQHTVMNLKDPCEVPLISLHKTLCRLRGSSVVYAEVTQDLRDFTILCCLVWVVLIVRYIRTRTWTPFWGPWIFLNFSSSCSTFRPLDLPFWIHQHRTKLRSATIFKLV